MQNEEFLQFLEALILTHKQERESEKGYPYNLILEKNEQHLFYIGANHSTDPNNDQFVSIDKNWQQFMALQGEKVVLIEGGEWEYIKNREESIKKHGEVTYLKHLAEKNNLKNYCAEPTFTSELEYLLSKHSKDEIFYFFIARYIRQWPSIKDAWPTDFNEYLKDQMSHLAKQTGWTDFNFSTNTLAKTHKKLFNSEINLEDFAHFTTGSNPTEEKSVINEVASNSSRFRDIYIVQQIAKEWKNGKHIFIVFGCSHVVRQEPAIKAIVGV